MKRVYYFLCELSVRLFPKKYEQYVNERRAQSEAMQRMLNESAAERELGFSVDYINNSLAFVLKRYNAGKYEVVKSLLS